MSSLKSKIVQYLKLFRTNKILNRIPKVIHMHPANQVHFHTLASVETSFCLQYNYAAVLGLLECAFEIL